MPPPTTIPGATVFAGHHVTNNYGVGTAAIVAVAVVVLVIAAGAYGLGLLRSSRLS